MVTIETLREFATNHQDQKWATKTGDPFSFVVTESGIRITIQNGNVLPTSNRVIATFCDAYDKQRSFDPGDYPDSRRKSYLLPIIKKLVTGP